MSNLSKSGFDFTGSELIGAFRATRSRAAMLAIRVASESAFPKKISERMGFEFLVVLPAS
jgi:hypothetical protein